jgi:hypothetical protein
MSITPFENTQNIQALQIVRDEMDVITTRTFPLANGYYTCPCGSVVKGIRGHLTTGKHQAYETLLINSITRYTQLIATYEREQQQQEEDEEDEALRRCHICAEEPSTCSCADDYINYKSYHGKNGNYHLDDMENNYHNTFIDLYMDLNPVDMEDGEAVEDFILNDEDCKYLMDEGEHLEYINTDEVENIKNELINHTTITPDICNIIADYAANIDFDDFYHDMIEDDKIENLTRHEIVGVDLCYFGHEQELCLVFMSQMYRDDHYTFKDGYLYTLDYIGKDEYGNARYTRTSNRGMLVKDFRLLDYGHGNFTIQYKDL